MEKNLYIDASHPDETRVVLKSENYIYFLVNLRYKQIKVINKIQAYEQNNH